MSIKQPASALKN